MNVYLAPDPGLGRAIQRTAQALQDYAPAWVQVVADRTRADFEVVHALGDGQRVPLTKWDPTIPYAMIQYCVRTTETPHTRDWVRAWRRARVVWSYYDLPRLLLADGESNILPRFYHAPLGLGLAFAPQDVPKTHLIGTSGYIAATEGIDEWAVALAQLPEARGFHLGPRLKAIDNAQWRHESGMSDQALALWWSSCQYVAAMRRVEGFEFPGIEGLACGARPICFRRPHYFDWYGEHAEYVTEGEPGAVIDELLAIVRGPYRAVTQDEMAWARERFSWRTIVGEFWRRVEASL